MIVSQKVKSPRSSWFSRVTFSDKVASQSQGIDFRIWPMALELYTVGAGSRGTSFKSKICKDRSHSIVAEFHVLFFCY